jgi:hypothetical protein
MLLDAATRDRAAAGRAHRGQLDEIDQALLRLQQRDNRRVTDKVGLDGARWLDAVRSRARYARRIARLSGPPLQGAVRRHRGRGVRARSRQCAHAAGARMARH